MANTRTITTQFKKEGLPLELVRCSMGGGYHYFVYDTLDEDVPNAIYDTRSIMCSRFGDLTPHQWLQYGREFAEEMQKLGY